MRAILSGLLLVLLALPAPDSHATPPAGKAAATASDAQYVDISEYLTDDADINAWYNTVINLKRNFDDICGDSFCEGDYSNIESLDYRCSVEKNSGIVGRCLWVFAASNEDISASDGRILVDTQTWKCRSPLAKKTRVGDLVRVLDVPEPIHAILPGTSQSIYDGLVDCL
jgi:hypothetical protein